MDREGGKDESALSCHCTPQVIAFCRRQRQVVHRRCHAEACIPSAQLLAVHPPNSLGAAGLGCLGPIPNNYSDCNSTKGCMKCDMLGMVHGTDMTDGSWNYPNGTAAERAKIWRQHIEFIQGLLWFWSSDPSVPTKVRNEINSYGHCKDEYDADSDPPHWPHQLCKCCTSICCVQSTDAPLRPYFRRTRGKAVGRRVCVDRGDTQCHHAGQVYWSR